MCNFIVFVYLISSVITPDALFICLVCAFQFAVIMFALQINVVRATLASVNRVYSLVA
jgi:hypothetical protein